MSKIQVKDSNDIFIDAIYGYLKSEYGAAIKGLERHNIHLPRHSKKAIEQIHVEQYIDHAVMDIEVKLMISHEESI